MRFIEDIYHRKARVSFVFNNFYDEKVMEGFDDIKEKTRGIVDMVYDLHVKNRSPFSFYGYRMEHMGQTYDIYINFDAKVERLHAHERPLVFSVDVEAAWKQGLHVL